MKTGDSIPIVSVLLTAYNHEDFIAEAIDGVLAQEAEFPIEVLIGDDCSQDRTLAIICQYQERFPDRVRVFPQDQNQGGHENFSRLYRHAKGRYVALLEGDDCWTDPHKLAKQVTCLEAHRECSVCFHPVKILYQDESNRAAEISNQTDPETSGLERITRFNYLWTCSVLFRNGLIPDLPEWVRDLPLGDWPLSVLLAEHGNLRMLRDVMAVYRVHRGGVWGSRPLQQRLISTVRVAEICRLYLGHAGFDDCICKVSWRIAKTAWRNQNCNRAITYGWKAMRAYVRMPPEMRRRLKYRIDLNPLRQVRQWVKGGPTE